ncbi:MAG: ABC transporter permease subunit [Thermoanaerobaculia bacterium]|nr:ABC transporter permease subunit [Thermoanaerobaculia bacterium]
MTPDRHSETSSLSQTLRDIRLLYVRELRDALREKSIVINSLLLPMLMYPIMLWLMFTAMTFVQGQQDRFVSRVALQGLPADHGALRESLAEDGDGRFELQELADADAVDELIRAGELDLAVRAIDAAGSAADLEDNVAFELIYDASKDRSDTARNRFEDTLGDYRADWLENAAIERGVSRESWDLFSIKRRNTASSSDMGSFMLGMMVPLLTIIMIAVGCFYPAIDATAGERERSTWETLMTVSASRTSVVVAKYLYVATLGTAAGLINLFALTLSMGSILQPMLGDEASDLSFEMPLEALPLIGVSSLLLAFFVAAGMLLFASFARTFKEGQSMIGPFYLVCLLPPMLVNSPDLELTLGWALVPVANVALLIRGFFSGLYPWELIGVVFAVEIITIVLLLWLVRWVLSFENVLSGSYNGDLLKFLKSNLGRGKAHTVNGDSK